MVPTGQMGVGMLGSPSCGSLAATVSNADFSRSSLQVCAEPAATAHKSFRREWRVSLLLSVLQMCWLASLSSIDHP